MAARIAAAILLLGCVVNVAFAETGRRELILIEAPTTAGVSKTVLCNTSVLTNGGNNTYICYNFATVDPLTLVSSASLPSGGGTASGTASGNIDPLYNQVFSGFITTANAGYKTPVNINPLGQLIMQDLNGSSVVTQSGWGGGPNVALGPQRNVVWGVHSTPSTNGLTSAMRRTQAAVMISWNMGDNTLNLPAAGGPAVATPGPAAFVPSGVAFTASITYTRAGSSSQTATFTSPGNMTCLQYFRNYTQTPTFASYTSPYMCHATIGALATATTYSYSITATVQAAGAATATTFATPAATVAPGVGGYTFKSMPSPSSAGAPSNGYPFNVVVMADVGQTYNSSLTAQYVNVYGSKVANGLNLIMNIGDLAYADNYGPTSNNLPNPGPGGTNQQRWDSMFTMWAPVFGQASTIHAAGNHEIDYQNGIAIGSKDTLATYSYQTGNAAGQPNMPFQSWATRVPNGAQAQSMIGDTASSTYYSQDLGPVHVIVLNNYIPFATGTPQYNWFVADIKAVDRVATPWLVVAFHAPPYHSYYTHYKEMECFMSYYENLFYQYRVDFVLNGHVHAYERTHPMYNYQLDTCGPIYLVVGDGGNVEGPYRNFVDDMVPGTNISFCTAAWTNSIKSDPYFAPSPGYQTQVHPAGCPITSYQPASTSTGGAPGYINNKVYDPSGLTYFCQSSQPKWSAYRDPSFGFSAITFVNDTTATFKWHRNIDQTPGSSTLNAIDQTSFTKYAGQCTGNLPALQQVATTVFSPANAIWSGQPYIANPTAYAWGSNRSALQNATAMNMRNPVNGAFTPVAASSTNGAWRAGDAFVTYATGFSGGVQSGDPLPGQIILWTRFQPSNDQSAKAAADPSNTNFSYNYLPAAGYIPIAVTWWVSTTNSSSAPLASGTYTTDGSRDWTVKLDVNYGVVQQQTQIYYGFSAADPATGVAYQAYGTFRSLSTAAIAELNYAVVSCSNWGFGYFNVYNMLANVDKLDFWSHVGDNFYEYKDLYYPSAMYKVRPLVLDPPHEIVSLDDYRRRNRLHRIDPDLQLLGAKVPFIALTDDHDYTNNAWMTFAENHQPTGVYPNNQGSGIPTPNPSLQGAGFDLTPYPEGDYYLRMEAAMKAWFEYMPIREGSTVYSGNAGNVGSAANDAAVVGAAAAAAYPGPYWNAATNQPTSLYFDSNFNQAVPGSAAPNVTAIVRWRLAKQSRSFDFGGVMTYALSENRLSYRSSSAAADQNGHNSPRSPTNMASVSAAIAALPGSNPSQWPQAAIQNVYRAYQSELSLQGGYVNCSTAFVDGPINGGCWQSYNNPNQHVIGDAQVSQVGSFFKASKAKNIPFQVWASQTCFFPSAGGDFYSAINPNGANANTRQGGKAAGFVPRMNYSQTPFAAFGQGAGSAAAIVGLPWNTDGWDGYQFERQQLLSTIAATANNVIINSGDAHTFWATKLSSDGVGGTPNMFEWCGGAVTSPGWGDQAAGYPAIKPGKVIDSNDQVLLQLVEDAMMISDAPNIVASRMPKGALVFKVTPTQYTGQMYTVNSIFTRSYNASCDNSFAISANKPGAAVAAACVNTINGVVPGPMVYAAVPASPPPAVTPTPSPAAVTPTPSPAAVTPTPSPAATPTPSPTPTPATSSPPPVLQGSSSSGALANANALLLPLLAVASIAALLL